MARFPLFFRLIILNNPANYISNEGNIDIRTDNPPSRGILQKQFHRSKPTSLPRSRFRGALRDETTNPLASRSTPSQRRPPLYCKCVTFILPKLLLSFKYNWTVVQIRNTRIVCHYFTPQFWNLAIVKKRFIFKPLLHEQFLCDNFYVTIFICLCRRGKLASFHVTNTFAEKLAC